LEADHALRALRQPVHQLALAFVTPLGADHDHVAARGLQIACLHNSKCLLVQMACTTHWPALCVSTRSQWSSSTSLSCPGSTQTTVSPLRRRAAMATRWAAPSPQDARMAARNGRG